ncbi:MAG: hypothetical protein OJF50_002536 [Nitrospira sp.]|nr:hypothetical protein [Nitrospira sp.]
MYAREPCCPRDNISITSSVETIRKDQEVESEVSPLKKVVHQ